MDTSFVAQNFVNDMRLNQGIGGGRVSKQADSKHSDSFAKVLEPMSKPAERRADRSSSETRISDKPHEPISNRVETSRDSRPDVKSSPAVAERGNPDRSKESSDTRDAVVQRDTAQTTTLTSSREETSTVDSDAPVVSVDNSMEKMRANGNESTGSAKVQAAANLPSNFSILETERSMNGQPDPSSFAMLKFLSKMKEDFQVEPQAVVKAFSDLSPEELSEPPAQNVDKIIRALDLPRDQVEAARQYLTELLGEREIVDFAESVESKGQSLVFEVLNKSEARGRDINDRLDKMNNSFFLKSQSQFDQPTTANAKQVVNRYGLQQAQSKLEHQEKLGGNEASKGHDVVTGSLFADGLKGQMRTTDGLGKTLNQPGSMTQVLSESSGAVQSMANENSLVKPSFSGEINGSKVNLESLGLTPIETVPLEGKVNLGLQKEFIANDQLARGEAQDFNEQASLLGQGLAVNDKGASSSLGKGFEDEAATESFADAFVDKTVNKVEISAKKFILQTPISSKEETTANVNEIVKQAKFLTEKGGGKMTVHLAPKGLGEVRLNVGVNEGQVNVEMIASSNDVKKSLEKGLSTLKSNLASHQLNLEFFRVDSMGQSQNLNNEMANEDRHFQERFLEDFSGGNRQFKQGLLDHFGEGRSHSQLEEEAEAIQKSAKKSSAASADGGQRRLDLVA